MIDEPFSFYDVHFYYFESVTKLRIKIVRFKNGSNWNGQSLEVKKAKESFFEKTARLRNVKEIVEEEKPKTEAFKAWFSGSWVQ